MIELNKKKEKVDDLIKLQSSLKSPQNLSYSISDIDKITKKANIYKSRFIKFIYLIFFILFVFVLYKIYNVFRKKTKTIDNVVEEIKKTLDDFK